MLSVVASSSPGGAPAAHRSSSVDSLGPLRDALLALDDGPEDAADASEIDKMGPVHPPSELTRPSGPARVLVVPRAVLRSSLASFLTAPVGRGLRFEGKIVRHPAKKSVLCFCTQFGEVMMTTAIAGRQAEIRLGPGERVTIDEAVRRSGPKVAEVRSNWRGTRWWMRSCFDESAAGGSMDDIREAVLDAVPALPESVVESIILEYLEPDEDELAVFYKSDTFGLRGPVQSHVFVPRRMSDGSRSSMDLAAALASSDPEGALLAQDTCVPMTRNSPYLSPETGFYQLDFFGRVTQKSVRNHQLVDCRTAQPAPAHGAPTPREAVLFQFGRTGPNVFSVDVEFPFSLIQAFGVAISALARKRCVP